ncbi:MAG: DUF4124 domain-containing protein [Pseudomonadota bacterium]
MNSIITALRTLARPLSRRAATALLLGALAGIAPALQAADVYRWVDANGVVNYTQQKPPGVEAVQVAGSSPRARRASRAPAPSTPAAATASAAADTDSAALTAQQQKMLDELKAKEAEREAAYAAARRDNCERSRSLLSKLSARGRIRLTQEDGSQIVMREEDRQARIQAAQQGVIDNC